LVSKQKFFWYGLSAVLYNAGIILGIIYLSPRFGIYGAVIGAVVGAILHLISRLIGLINYKIKYKIKISFDEHFKTFLKLMTPKMIGHPLEQLTFLGYTAIASSLGAGSIVVMNLARNFQSAPVAIIGINVALASFSVLSQSAARNDRREFVAELKFAMKMIFLITSLSAIGILLIKNFLISVLLGGGAFDDAAISATASALGIFTIAIPTESLNHILSRAFYSLKNSATPVIIGLTGMFLAICTGYLFSRDMGVNGLILGFVLGSVFKLILLFLFLKREIRIKL
jgi:putative peptidoglycan lipid II flippase